MHRPSLLGEVHFLCLLCGAARRRLSCAKRAITEWLVLLDLATDGPCACEACSTGVEVAEGRGTVVEYLCGVPRFIFAYWLYFDSIFYYFSE